MSEKKENAFSANHIYRRFTAIKYVIFHGSHSAKKVIITLVALTEKM
jgi:hypothetical protein